MTSKQAETLIALVTANNALLQAMAVHVESACAVALAAMESPTPEEMFVGGCQHPDESRVDISTPGDGNHWICNACRFDNKAVA